MEKHQVLETLKLVRDHSKKRNFSQSVDLIINLKGLNLKKPEENINDFVALMHPRGKEAKIGALVGDELASKANAACDLVIKKDDFRTYGTDPKKAKKMAKKIDFFVAQANLMPDIAKAFGKVLGPMGKMPNPRSGAVVPPIIPDLKPLVAKLKKTIKLQTKNEQVIKGFIGAEKMSDEELSDNVMTVYNHIFHLLHEDRSKIGDIILKFSMGRPFIVGKKYSKEEIAQNEIKPEKKEAKK